MMSSLPEWFKYIKATLDIMLVSVIFYWVVMLLKSTRAFEIVKGVIFVFVLWGMAKILDLTTLEYVISQVLLYGVLGFMILFQPELRTALEKIGKNNLSSKQTVYSSKQITINAIIDACVRMSASKTGALICIEMQDTLNEYIETGVELDAKVGSHLLESIFFINSPLHDGALFIRGNRIEAASGYLPLTERTNLPKELGTRHRASIGLTESTDALVIVVSEETGKISLIVNEEIKRPLTKDMLREELEKRLITTEDKKKASKAKKKRVKWGKGA